jgi:hypothetical protein
LDDHGNLPITETANRVRAGLDVEAVTKAFFRDFQAEHKKLLDEIRGHQRRRVTAAGMPPCC